MDVRDDSARAVNDATRYYGSAASSEVQSLYSSHEDAEGGSIPGEGELTAGTEHVQNFVNSNGSNLLTAQIQHTHAEDRSPRDSSFVDHRDAGDRETNTEPLAVNHLPNGSSAADRPLDNMAEQSRESLGQQNFTSQFRKYLSSDGNWKDLVATSLNWMLLDFTFYLLGVNSSSFVPTLFGQTNDRPPYSQLINQERNIMYSSSIGSLVGSLLAIVIFNVHINRWLPQVINSPRKVQIWGFGALSVLFVIVGSLYITLPSTGAVGAIVTFYELCQPFFNLGKLMVAHLGVPC